MSSLKLEGIGKIYPSGETSLYNVSLEAADREFVVIVGGEKCGKTSLLKVIAGLEEPTSGSVYIDGKDMADVEPKNRDIAMVFRSDTLYPTLNVFDNMAFGLRLRKAPQQLIEQRVKSAANILGLTEFLYRKPKVLSAAARQRVAIGRALVREPKLYLFDEPLAGIDENLRRDMLNVIVNLQARMQGTFVYATKNLSEALTIGTRIVVMKKGMVQQIDTPANLYDYPANTYVAFFIGSPTINFIKDASVVKDGEGYALEFAGGKLALSAETAARFTLASGYAESGKKVIAGVRPEDLTDGEEGELEGKFSKSEEADGVVYAEFETPCGALVGAVSKSYEKGQTVRLSVNGSRLYIFDAETRLTLLERDAGYVNTGHADADIKPLPYPEEEALFKRLAPKKTAEKKRK